MLHRTLLAILTVVLTFACSRTVVVRPEPAESRGPSTAATLGIPPGHLPPPGRCRVWIPGVPPGHQAKAGECAALARRVPAGGWLVYRPSKDRKHVKVSVYHDRHPGVVVAIRLFDAKSGKLVREESP